VRAAACATLWLALGCAANGRGKGDTLVPFGPAGITDSAARPQRHALVVGINAFQDSRFGRLRHAVADADAIGGALSDFEDVRVLASPELTTRTAILAEIAALESRLLTPNDTVVLYFSTHGSLGRTPGGELKRYLAASDTRLDLIAETGISIDLLVQKANAFRSRRTLLILAACHSGSGKSQIADDLASALKAYKSSAVPPLEEVSEAVIVLTAAAFGETAREDDALGHDVYTHFLLRALDEGDRDGDGAVTASEAHDYARERTYAHTGGSQRPTSESSVLGRDPIILRGRPLRIGNPVIYSYAPSAEGLEVLINGAHKGTLPGGIALQPGSYQLRLASAYDGSVLYEGKVQVRAGEYLELSSLLPRPAQLWSAIGAGVFVPASHALRAVIPPLPLALAHFAAGHFPFEGFRVELEAGVMTGSGEDTTTESVSVPFKSIGFLTSISLGAEIPFGRSFFASAGAGGGLLFLSRDYQGNFSGHQALRTPTVSSFVEAGWIATDRVRLTARLEAMLIFGDVDQSPGANFAWLPTANFGFGF
jgi:hypothetical protein